MVAAYSPRIRPGTPVSFPVPWDDLDGVAPADFTIKTALGVLADRDPWSDLMPEPQASPPTWSRRATRFRSHASRRCTRKRRAKARRDAG